MRTFLSGGLGLLIHSFIQLCASVVLSSGDEYCDYIIDTISSALIGFVVYWGKQT